MEREREIYRGYLIKINYDEDAESPREWENICTMNCYCRSYCIGDNQCKSNPWNDMRDIILSHIPVNQIISLAKKHCESVRITNNNKRWYLAAKFDGEWYDEFDCDIDERDWIADKIVENMDEKELYTIIDNSDAVAISNIYAYIHSGITISMERRGQYADPFDSGYLGFIYVTKDKMLKADHDLDDKTWEEKAYKIMEEEVKIYDDYLTGECFGWEVCAPIEKEDEDEWEDYPEESCWGYVGSEEIPHMIEEAKSVIDGLIVENEKKALKDAQELAHRRSVLSDNLDKLQDKQYVIADAIYCINRHNLFGFYQICRAEISHHEVNSTRAPVDILNLEETVVNVLYEAIYQP